MKELENYIQSVNTCSDSLIREVWSDQDECSMIFPKGEVEGLEAILTSFYHGAMAQYETRDLRQDDVKIQEFCDITIVRFYWTLHATMKESGECIVNKHKFIAAIRKVRSWCMCIIQDCRNTDRVYSLLSIRRKDIVITGSVTKKHGA